MAQNRVYFTKNKDKKANRSTKGGSEETKRPSKVKKIVSVAMLYGVFALGAALVYFYVSANGKEYLILFLLAYFAMLTYAEVHYANPDKEAVSLLKRFFQKNITSNVPVRKNDQTNWTISGNVWKCESMKLLISPSYFGFVLAVALVFLLLFLPAVGKATEVTNELQNSEAGKQFAAGCARLFADSMGGLLVFFPAFVASTCLLRDKRKTPAFLQGEKTTKTVILVRTIVTTAFLFLPVLFAAVAGSFAAQIRAEQVAMQLDASIGGTILSFLGYSVTWLLPTLFFVVSLSVMVTVLTKSCLAGILTEGVLWIVSLGSTAETGDYNSALAIRHAVFGEGAAVTNHISTLIVNRIIVVALGLIFCAAALSISTRRANKQE